MSWNIDGNSVIGFSVKHLMFSTVHGRFRTVRGTVDWDHENPANSVIQAEVDAMSVETGDKNRDKSVRSPDFFDAINYPVLTFKSKQVKKVSRTKFQLIGDLTIKQVTNEVAFEVEYTGRSNEPFVGSSAVFKATTQLNRKHFGLGWNPAIEAGGVMVGDQVKIEMSVRVLKSAALLTEESNESAA
jgi:polyisoprenoid-binding protein YceI